jgi:hypothetical protein
MIYYTGNIKIIVMVYHDFVVAAVAIFGLINNEKMV